MGVCQTVLPFLSNPVTWGGLFTGGIGLKLLYSYSSLSFWPSILSASAIWRTLMTTISAATGVMRTDLLKYFAAVTTFSQTIGYLLTGNLSLSKLGSTFLTEFYNKIILTVPNFVEGLGHIVQWLSGLGTSNGVCTLTSNLGVLGQGVKMIWISLAAYLFILWIWKSMWYDWRNVEMEQQEVMLVVGLVSAVSISAHSTAVLLDGWSNGVSLADTLAQIGGDMWPDTGLENTTAVNGTDPGNVTNSTN